MSQERARAELSGKTQQLLQGTLKHTRAAALAAMLVPVASLAASQPTVQLDASGGVRVTVSAGCDSYTFTANGTGLTQPGTVEYTISITTSGPPTIITGSIPISPPPDGSGVFTATATGSFGQVLSSDAVLSGSATVFEAGIPGNTVPINVVFSGPCPPNGARCIASNSIFGLGSAAGYTVLGQRFADIDFGSSATLVAGDVGVGPHDTGSLIKATIDGTLFLDPTANPSIHDDLNVTGGIVSQDLTSAVNDADAANATNAAKPATQAGVNVADVPFTTITLANPSGPNVIPVTAVNTHGMIAIAGESTATVVFNVTGGFTCNGCSVVLAANTPGSMPIPPQNVLWNFIGTGGDVSISKPVGAAQGIFLAPNRNLLLDKASLVGGLIGAENGLRLLVHSGARLTCPR